MIQNTSEIIKSGWTFRITNFEDTQMLLCFHEKKCFSHLRFFQSEVNMYHFMEMVCKQTELLDKGID